MPGFYTKDDIFNDLFVKLEKNKLSSFDDLSIIVLNGFSLIDFYKFVLDKSLKSFDNLISSLVYHVLFLDELKGEIKKILESGEQEIRIYVENEMPKLFLNSSNIFFQWEIYNEQQMGDFIINFRKIFHILLNKTKSKIFFETFTKNIFCVETLPSETCENVIIYLKQNYWEDGFKESMMKALHNDEKLIPLILHTLRDFVQNNNTQLSYINKGIIYAIVEEFPQYARHGEIEETEKYDGYYDYGYEDEDDYDKSDEEIEDVIPDNTSITDETLMSLNRIEIKNRIGKVLYKGEAREKGKIYSDTIQKYISEVTNGNKKYDFIDGKKVLQPFTEEITQKLNYLQSLLQKSKQSGFIVFEDESNYDIGKIKYNKENTTQNEINDDMMNQFMTLIKTIGKFKAYSTQSEYTYTNMQTLLPESKWHSLYHIYLSNTDEIFEQMNNALSVRLRGAIENNVGHQRVNNDLLQIGFVRYHYDMDSQIWINTIQSDVTVSLGLKKEKFKNEVLNELYALCVGIAFRNFIKYLNKLKFEYITIPTSNTRGELFGERNKGFTYGYDELPKLFGFSKGIFGDTVWYDYYTETHGSKMKIKKLNVWSRSHLNENKEVK